MGGRIILQTPVVYQQIAAGALQFSLYNKRSNAVVPATIVEGDGFIEIRENATPTGSVVYKIDRFAGSKSDIALYAENNSADVYSLYDVTQRDDVTAVRLFTQAIQWQEGEASVVYAEINGRLYVPYKKVGNDWPRIASFGSTVETLEDDNIDGFGMLFPKTEVDIVQDPVTGSLDTIKFLEFNDATANINSANEVVYKQSYDGDEPWRFGQDGYFEGKYLNFVRINGINHAIVIEGTNASPEDPGIHPEGSEQNVYNTPGIKLECAWGTGRPIAEAKANETEEYGLEFGDDLEAVNGVVGDLTGPFEQN